jgi:biopolymer transport protein ExbD/biopolymer transport protein TolR
MGMSAYTDGASQRWSPFDRARKRKARRAEYYCSIDAAALASVFVVLFFILVIVQPPPHSRTSVDLAKTEYSILVPAARREDAMIVAVTRDGQLYFASRRIARDELPERILEALRSGAENRVYLLVDARAAYSDVLMALQGVQRAKIGRVTFLTEALQR